MSQRSIPSHICLFCRLCRITHIYNEGKTKRRCSTLTHTQKLRERLWGLLYGEQERVGVGEEGNATGQVRAGKDSRRRQFWKGQIC